MKKGCFMALLCWMSYTWSLTPAELFQKKWQAIRTMQANFDQVIYAKNRQISKGSGKMALWRPAHFRWETQAPMSQLVLADGKRLWVYDVDLEQVTVRNQAQNTEASAGLFLSDDKTNLLQLFNISVKQQGKQEEFVLDAKSSRSDFKRVKFQFEGSQLLGLELFDPLGQRTQIHFKHIKTNAIVSAKLFQFTPPTGVDVVNEGDARE
jgi:outer membrane lipoprotein carrier protein